MKHLLKYLFLFFVFIFSTVNLPALNLIGLWRHSEIAQKNSVFCDIGLAPVVFNDPGFPVLPADIRFEYLPPFPLPLGLGFFFKTPFPNLKSFGVRAAYHFDLLDDFTDLYIVHSFDFGFFRNDLLVVYNDTPVEIHLFDFRVGVRRFFGQYFGLSVESGFKFQSVIILVSIKLN